MAAVSEVTATRIVQSYVSSNSYYGYVPPINETTSATAIKFNSSSNNNQYFNYSEQSKVHLNNQNSDERAYHQHQHLNQQNNGNGLAMETDDDTDSHYKFNCQTNHCVIPEMVMRLDNNINTRSSSVGDPGGQGRGDSVGLIYRMNHSDADADAARPHNNNNNNSSNNNCNGMISSMEINRRNRKRNNYDHPGVDEGFSHGQLKKFRPDGGNKRVCHDTRSCTRDSGSSAMRWTTHLVSQVVDFSCNNGSGYPVLQPGKLCETRVTARDNTRDAKNISLLSVTSANNVVDYETMLMETHGCSAYHLHRHQFLDVEAEF